MGQCFTSSRIELSTREQRNDLQRARNQIADLQRELRAQREKSREQMNAMQRDHSNQVAEMTRALSLKEEELRRLRGQRDRDWVINRNEIVITSDQQLGEGAWATVYRGEFRGCDVAVKEMYPDIMSNYHREAFVREAEMASRCRHPCLLQFIGATTDERPVIITEIMECSLRTRLYIPDEPPLCEREITVISLDVAKALNYLHERPQPINHHDISSGNVLLWRHGHQWRAKVSDYGTVNLVRRSNINYAGAANYCAPEFLNPEQRTPISCKVDVYSFGVLLCEMCIREQPAPHDRERQIDEIRNLNYRRLVRQCVHKHPRDRYSMDEVIDELQASMSNTHQLQGPQSRRISSAWQTTGGDGLTIVDC